jgi:hypothetical protein
VRATPPSGTFQQLNVTLEIGGTLALLVTEQVEIERI